LNTLRVKLAALEVREVVLAMSARSFEASAEGFIFSRLHAGQ